MRRSGLLVFLATSLGTFAALFAAWVGVETLRNLDEFLAASSPDRSWLDVAARYFDGVIRWHGATLSASVGLASVAVGGLAVLRFVIPRSRTIG